MVAGIVGEGERDRKKKQGLERLVSSGEERKRERQKTGGSHLLVRSKSKKGKMVDLLRRPVVDSHPSPLSMIVPHLASVPLRFFFFFFSRTLLFSLFISRRACSFRQKAIAKGLLLRQPCWTAAKCTCTSTLCKWHLAVLCTVDVLQNYTYKIRESLNYLFVKLFNLVFEAEYNEKHHASVLHMLFTGISEILSRDTAYNHYMTSFECFSCSFRGMPIALTTPLVSPRLIHI
jgi:hypothetical protein